MLETVLPQFVKKILTTVNFYVVEWVYGMSGYDALVVLRKDLMLFTS